VHVIRLWRIPHSHWEQLSAVMEVPFPELTYLHLGLYGEAVLPDSFLGGSAPSLRFLSLNHITFSGLPKLLLSATHLVELHLWCIHHSGYFSPEAMATALSALTHLERFALDFRSPLSLALTGRANLCLPRHALSSLFSHIFRSKGTTNTWTTSWPTSMPLN
jgi:hypothetical protein